MGDDLRTTIVGANRRQLRSIWRIVVHEEYNKNARIPQNDIALLILQRPFVETDTFRSVNVTDAGPVDEELCRIGKSTK